MITLTIVERKKVKNMIHFQRKIVSYHSIDKARKEIPSIVKEMHQAKLEKREAKIEIVGCSYDTGSEKRMLLELHAIESIENESNNGY